MDCDFCDRLFGPNAAGKHEGITRIDGPLDDPDDPNPGWPGVHSRGNPQSGEIFQVPDYL